EKRDGEGTAGMLSRGLGLGGSWIAVRVTVAVQDDAYLVGLVVGCFQMVIGIAKRSRIML
ncbi:MAG: hypothetical protein KAI47_10365, partial [Deltaproteobacteria bacterium]|nr:hypothetical protein [Deltaproteobacteria bacterium]